jgi:D-alanyl-D-alanine dipeptidase
MAESSNPATLERLSDDFVDLTDHPAIRVDLRYATPRNFTGQNVYGAFDRLLLHRLAAKKLLAAAARLEDRRPDLRLLVLDGLRPNRVQRLFWDHVKGTALQHYVGDPATGSIHGFGLAVDVTLVAADGGELDMGTRFDDFSALAEPRQEEAFLRSGALGAAQVGNRRLLRAVMEQAGFSPIAIEWWHFDALPPHEVRVKYPLVEEAPLLPGQRITSS